MNKKVGSIILSILLLLPNVLVFGASHWAQSEMDYLLNKGVILGDALGLRPEDEIKRAEFAKTVNRLFGFNEEALESFIDVTADKWYYQEMKIAKKAGYLTGDETGRANPEGVLTRAEASVVLARLLNFSGNTIPLSFTDHEKIPAWAKASIGALTAQGVIKGYQDGSFQPSNSMKRAEVFVTLVRAEKLMKQETKSEDPKGIASLNTLNGGSSSFSGGGGGGGNAPQKTEFLRINQETFDLVWSQQSGATSYSLKILRTTNQYNQEKILTFTGTSTNIKAELDQMTEGTREVNESFELAIKSNKDSGYSSSKTFSYTYPAIKIPADLKAVSIIEENGEETVSITWSVEAAAERYELAVQFTPEGEFEKIPYTVENGMAYAKLSKEDLGTIRSSHPIQFRGYSNNEALLDSVLLKQDLSFPLYSEGEGSMKNPYVIRSQRHFNNIRLNPSAFYILAGDITLPDSYVPFEFNGQLTGDTTDLLNLRQITVNIDSKKLSTANDLGLFSAFPQGKIRNIALAGSVSGTNFIGGFAGTSKGTIENCVNYATITGTDTVGGIIGSAQGGSLTRVVNYGTLTGRTNCGGIIGTLNGASVNIAANLGTITSSGSNIGGISGLSYQGVTNSFNTGAVKGVGKVGGIAGYCAGKDGKIENCYNTGTVEATGSGTDNMAGGILGGLWIDKNRNMTIKSSYNVGLVQTASKSFDPIYPSYTPTDITNYIDASDCYYLSADHKEDGKNGTVAVASHQLKEMKIGVLVKSNQNPYEYPQNPQFLHLQKAGRLSAPAIARVEYLDEKVTAFITGDNNSLKYQVQIYLDETATQLLGEVSTLEGGETQSIEITSFIQEYRQYYLKVIAQGDQYFYLDSQSELSSYLHRAESLPQPILIGKYSWGEMDQVEEYQISWEPINHKKLSAFEVKLYEAGNLVHTKYLDKTANSYGLKEEEGITFGGEFTIKLRAISEQSEENSNEVSVAIDTMFAEGAGTGDNPYILKNARHFKNIKNKQTAHYLVAANIDLTDGYTPFSFSGQIAGGKTTMWDLYSIKVDIQGNGNNVGLFSGLSAGAKVSYLELQGTVTNGAGFNYTGGFAGTMGANNTLSNCINRANITSAYNYVGGLVGYANSSSGKIENCYNYGAISGNSIIGGLLGSSYATVTDSGNYGFVTAKSNHLGGIVGNLVGNVIKSFNAGRILATSTNVNTHYAGGIAGTIPSNTPDGRKIENCFNVGSIEAPIGTAGGIVANILNSSFSVLNCYHAGALVHPENLYYPIYKDHTTASIKDCYYLSETEKSDLVNETTALKEEDMKNLNNFVNWDHGKEDSVWILYTNDGYYYPQIAGNLYVESEI